LREIITGALLYGSASIARGADIAIDLDQAGRQSAACFGAARRLTGVRASGDQHGESCRGS
jgi:hypothetical protein